MVGEPDRVRRGLRTGVDGDREPSVRLANEELRRAHPLLRREQEALARRTKREEAAEPAPDEEVHIRLEGALVERLALVRQRRDRRRERSSKHGRTLRRGSVSIVTIPVADPARTGHMFLGRLTAGDLGDPLGEVGAAVVGSGS